MANENIKKIGCSVFAALLLSTCILMLVAAWRLPSLRAKRISNNLVDGGFFSSEDECLISRDPREYISAMFPIGEANIDYVTTGMQGYKVIKRVQLTTCDDGRELTVIFYALVELTYEVYFAFCGDELVNIGISD